MSQDPHQIFVQLINSTYLGPGISLLLITTRPGILPLIPPSLRITMKAFVIVAMCCVGAQAFVPVPKGSFGVKATPQAQSSSSTVMMAKSKSLPFLDQPAALDGTMPGDVGFDPLGLTENINLPYGMCRRVSMFIACVYVQISQVNPANTRSYTTSRGVSCRDHVSRCLPCGLKGFSR